jgi:hypothetical protein
MGWKASEVGNPLFSLENIHHKKRAQRACPASRVCTFPRHSYLCHLQTSHLPRVRCSGHEIPMSERLLMEFHKSQSLN